MARSFPRLLHLQDHHGGEPARGTRRRDHFRELEGHAEGPRLGAARGQYLRTAIVPAYLGPAVDPAGKRNRSAKRDVVSGRADRAGRRHRYLRDRPLSRSLHDRGRQGALERAHRGLRQFAGRYSFGVAAVSASTVALTIGDPNGIGPEIAVKAAAQMAREGGPAIVLVGDEFILRHYAERHASDLTLAPLNGAPPRAGVLSFQGIDALARKAFNPGSPVAAGGRATVDYVSAAIRLVNEGLAAAVVACPHSETNVNAAGIPFSGYPSLLARLTGKPEDHVFLMLVGGGLLIVHVTLHERLQTALARLTPELIDRAVRTAADALRQLDIRQPRIGLFGINPHAGENGLFGDDDDRITVPAAASLRAAGID